MGFPGGSDSKESACNVEDLGWEDPLEEDMATHFSILAWRIPMDREAWQATVHKAARVGHDLASKQQSASKKDKTVHRQ